MRKRSCQGSHAANNKVSMSPRAPWSAAQLVARIRGQQAEVELPPIPTSRAEFQPRIQFNERLHNLHNSLSTHTYPVCNRQWQLRRGLVDGTGTGRNTAIQRHHTGPARKQIHSRGGLNAISAILLMKLVIIKSSRWLLMAWLISGTRTSVHIKSSSM